MATVGCAEPPGAYWAQPLEQVLDELDTTPAGLSTSEAHARSRRAKREQPHKERTRLVLLLRQFASPITLILVVATIIAAILGEAVDAAIILSIILLSGLLSFWQEYSASRAVEELLASVRLTAEVMRDGHHSFVPANEVVSGDVVLLDTGDLVPADCVLLESAELSINESVLTGESYPRDKATGCVATDTPLSARSNCLFRGTHVVRGTGTAAVVRTGGETEFGQIARELEERQPPTQFERGLTAFGGLLLRVMLVLVGVIFIANVLLARSVIDSLLFSVALAVGLTPQLLPAIVSISLSLGARRMARAKVIVKRLSAIEDFGGMNILCTDKTGTLTQGTVRLASALDIWGRSSPRVLRAAYLNSLCHTGFSNPIDEAILHTRHIDTIGTQRLDELPYDFQRRRLSVLIDITGEAVLITKGAVDSVAAICDMAETSDGISVPMVEAAEVVRQHFEALSQQGYRALAVARKAMPGKATLVLSDEGAMTFMGFVTFRDPPKPGIKHTLRELRALGISLRMVTGDSRLAAAHVARAVGLETRQVVTGAELTEISDDQLEDCVRHTTVFAEVDPVQKLRIIRALQRGGYDVGYLGDGINDAPSLHAADVGISVNSAVEVARDAASIVLLEKNLDVLLEGVRVGRRTFANTLKYIFVTTSANFGNMASMAAVSVLLPFLPLLPLQILLINFLTDLPGTTIASDRVDPEHLRQPGVWDLRAIRNFMIVFGLVSSAFDFITFGVLRLGFAADEGLFRSAWLIESVATELAVMLVLRTQRPFFRSRPSGALLWSSLAVALIAVVIPYTAAAEPLGLVPLPGLVLLALVAITTGYVVTTEVAKAFFYSRWPHAPKAPSAHAHRPAA
jgi:Mg2+-importing ATPase